MSKFNWSQYERQNVQAVDMCASCIFTHRQKLIPIKAIHLYPKMYEQFKQWLGKKRGSEIGDDERMEFDSVEICKGYAGQSTPMVVELWEANPFIDVTREKVFSLN